MRIVNLYLQYLSDYTYQQYPKCILTKTFQGSNLTRYLFVLKIINFLHKGRMKAITLLADIVNNSKTETIMII